MFSDVPITKIDADEAEQGMAELEDVITLYGMLKSFFLNFDGE